MNSVVFSTSATPTGNFPIGTTVVMLRVSDGMASDTDTVSITAGHDAAGDQLPGQHHGGVHGRPRRAGG